jgi:hypothetical protein
MTDTTETTSADATPVRYGEGAADALKAYDEIVEAAQAAYRNTCTKIQEPYRKVANALEELLGVYSPSARALVQLADQLSQPARDEGLKVAQEIRDSKLERAEEAKRKALESDPFLHYLDTTIRRSYSGYVSDLLSILPATLDEIKNLADDLGWCTEFERLFSEATKLGHVDTGTFTYTTTLSLDEVPGELNAKEGEEWQVEMVLHGYMRPHMYDSWELGRYAVSKTYRKVRPAAEADTDA